jgi:hypothetical protein
MQEATAAGSKHKEVKVVKAYDTYEALAQLTTFHTHADVLLLPVRVHLLPADALHCNVVFAASLLRCGLDV